MSHGIYGLVLVGGKSERMGSDKALLTYGSQDTQLERTATLLHTVCERVYVSQRKEQNFECPQIAEPIYDSIQGIHGPLCGILSAMATHPNAHWLVLACDLPFITQATLEKLIAHFRATQPKLTAYQSTYDGLPEPLCALYPSGSDQGLIELSKELGKSCPRKLLIVQQAQLVQQDDPRSLDNINTAEEYARTIETI
ncbi:MAG TPA: molybdenum cofactor guanylyltransferase [Opitutae bacterium]|nr:molybdenum cofactor guanylyltransferase [Opitutae bacterium]